MRLRQLSYLLGEGLGEDRDQVLQRTFGVELTGVLGGASLLRGLRLDETERERTVNKQEVKKKNFLLVKGSVTLTSEASMARSISSSQTLDQNSMPCSATSSMSLFIASMVI